MTGSEEERSAYSCARRLICEKKGMEDSAKEEARGRMTNGKSRGKEGECLSYGDFSTMSRRKRQAKRMEETAKPTCGNKSVKRRKKEERQLKGNTPRRRNEKEG